MAEMMAQTNTKELQKNLGAVESCGGLSTNITIKFFIN